MSKYLQDIFNHYRMLAKRLLLEEHLDYSGMPAKDIIRQLLDGYCKAKDEDDEDKKNLYIAGLMLRFWYIIKKLKEKSPGLGLDDSDFMAWLYEAIEYACKYRKWQKDVSVNAQQCVNQCIETIRLQHYYSDCNRDKNKANYNTVSFDQTINDQSDSKQVTTVGDVVADDSSLTDLTRIENDAYTRGIIQKYINNKKLVEAIILDTIAFNDTRKSVKSIKRGVDSEGKTYKYVKTTTKFYAPKCVKLLNSISTSYENYFKTTYKIKPTELTAAITAIKSSNNQKLKRYVDKTVSTIANL